MAPFRDRLGAQDLADLAAYIGDPLVPSPQVALLGEDGRELTLIDLGDVVAGTIARTSLRLANTGLLPVMIVAEPAIAGRDAAELAIATRSCAAGASVAPGRVRLRARS